MIINGCRRYIFVVVVAEAMQICAKKEPELFLLIKKVYIVARMAILTSNA